MVTVETKKMWMLVVTQVLMVAATERGMEGRQLVVVVVVGRWRVL